jgi:hypothetical protein
LRVHHAGGEGDRVAHFDWRKEDGLVQTWGRRGEERGRMGECVCVCRGRGGAGRSGWREGRG